LENLHSLGHNLLFYDSCKTVQRINSNFFSRNIFRLCLLKRYFNASFSISADKALNVKNNRYQGFKQGCLGFELILANYLTNPIYDVFKQVAYQLFRAVLDNFAQEKSSSCLDYFIAF